MAKDVEIILKKEGEKDITVKCPRTVKLSALRVYLAINMGLPPLSIKPADMKGLGITVLAFLAIFVACAFFTVSIGLGAIVLAAVLVFNFVYTKNYFFNFIKKKLAEGYSVDDAEQNQILQEAGVFEENQKTPSEKNKFGFAQKINGLINLLPFNSFAARLPVVSKFSRYANHIVCVLIALIIISVVTSKSPAEQLVSDIESLAKTGTTLVTKCEKGEMSYDEFENKMQKLAQEMIDLEDKYKGIGIQDGDFSEEQTKRILKAVSDWEKIQARAERLELKYYLQ